MISFNSDYWDCECETDYIHKKSEKNYCANCQTFEHNQPDSRQDEVKNLGD